MPNMDVFNTNAFSMQQLTASLLDQPHIPLRLGQMGIFSSAGVRTLKVSVERKGNTLELVQTTARGGPGQANKKDLRDILDIPTARLAMDDAVEADTVQNIRAFGSESELQTLVAEVNERNMRMSRNIDITEEYHRICALKGIILDADGSTLLNLFTLFDVTQQTEIDWDLDNATPASGALRKQCAAVIRLIKDELGGLPYQDIYTMCSSQFWDDLIAHVEVRETVKNWPAALTLRETGVGAGGNAQPVKQLDFGGITFEEYRGSVGGTDYVADDKAHTFPIGVVDLYLTRYAPAEYWETVNTVGLPRYARQSPDPHAPDSKRLLRVQSQELSLCTRPRVLIPGKRT